MWSGRGCSVRASGSGNASVVPVLGAEARSRASGGVAGCRAEAVEIVESSASEVPLDGGGELVLVRSREEERRRERMRCVMWVWEKLRSLPGAGLE